MEEQRNVNHYTLEYTGEFDEIVGRSWTIVYPLKSKITDFAPDMQDLARRLGKVGKVRDVDVLVMSDTSLGEGDLIRHPISRSLWLEVQLATHGESQFFGGHYGILKPIEATEELKREIGELRDGGLVLKATAYPTITEKECDKQYKEIERGINRK